MAKSPEDPGQGVVRSGLWPGVQLLSVASFLGLCAMLVLRPAAGLFVFWRLVVPLLPLLFFVAPGLWRNICPLAAANQAPRRFGFSRAWTAPRFLRDHGYVVAISAFLVIVPTRKVLFNGNGAALAALLAAVILGAFSGGFVLKGKSGWCSSICPLLPVQRLYGQTPFVAVGNTHCEPCVTCTRNCYDLSPHTAYQADMHEPHPWWRSPREFFAGAFPGVILAFYRVPSPPVLSVPGVYLGFAGYALLSVSTFIALDAKTPITRSQLAAVYGAVAINLFYWFNAPLFLVAAGQVTGFGLGLVLLPLRLVIGGLSVVWVIRTGLAERKFAGAFAPAASPQPVPVPMPVAIRSGEEVHFDGIDGPVRVSSGCTILEAAEQAGVPIEAGCRLGLCGADPVTVLEGAEHLSPMGPDEVATLTRLGMGRNARLACSAEVRGCVRVALPGNAAEETVPASIVPASIVPVDHRIGSVVVIGNGIAGITAAEAVRRSHPGCDVHVIAREAFPLYNRMGISRLIHGRSAMQGLSLLPDDWHDRQGISLWLNTQVQKIDRPAREVVVATGERIRWDRLILAMGSASAVPPLPGFGLEGSFVLREADDALAVRRYAQERGARWGVVAGGGLLGLEAAYALHQLGLRVVVLERAPRLLANQVDERTSALLAAHLERSGLAVQCGTSIDELSGVERVEHVRTADGGVVPADVLLVCAGIAPRIELAREAGLTVNRGIVVDGGMRTSDPDVFAAGDVAEFEGRVVGLWPVAIAQAEVAAQNALGGREIYAPEVPVTILKGAGVPLTAAGRMEPEADEEVFVKEGQDGATYAKLVVAGDGRVVGAVVLGRPDDGRRAMAALRDRRDITSVLDRIRAGDWSALDEAERPVPAFATSSGT